MTAETKPGDRRALAGITVLDLTRLLPGAFCTLDYDFVLASA